MSNEAQHLLNHIQYKTGKTLDEIAQEIGYSRPYLNKVKLKGAEGGKIIGVLKAKYVNELQDVSSGTGLKTQQKEDPYHDKYVDSILEQKRILEVQNEFLRRNFETSLVSIVEGQQQTGIHLKALSWLTALAAAGGDEKKAQDSILILNNKIAAFEGVSTGGGIFDGSDKKGNAEQRQQKG